MTPLITTIVPTFRRPQLLRRAVQSALNQSFNSIKVLVCDNASNDETRGVIAELSAHDDRVEYHCHAENIGGAANFIWGLHRVETPYFSFLADDDILFPRFYERAIAAATCHPEAMFVGGQTVVMENEEFVRVSPSCFPEGLHRPPDAVPHILRQIITWTSILFRSEVRETVGIIDPGTGIWMEQDMELRVARRFPIVYVAEPFTVWTLCRDYPHRSAFLDNWLALLRLGAQHLKSDEISGRTRIQFWSWFLRQLRGSTLAVPRLTGESIREYDQRLRDAAAAELRESGLRRRDQLAIRWAVHLSLGSQPIAALFRAVRSARSVSPTTTDQDRELRNALRRLLVNS